MCRNIRPLFNFAPPATDAEIRAAALQFVRKVLGSAKPSQQNQAVFDAAIEEIFVASRKLIDGLVPHGPPKDREVEAEKARAKSRLRFQRPA